MDELTNADRAKFFSKLSRITGAVINLEKDATNNFHKYDYVSADNVLQAIAPLMAEENIALISETLEVGIDEKVYMPKYRFTFVCGDTGYMHPCEWYGETVHTSNKGTRDDKALNKAATISQKYFLLKTFLIATGDDPDGAQGSTQQTKQQSSTGHKPQPKQAEETPHPTGNQKWHPNEIESFKDRFDIRFPSSLPSRAKILKQLKKEAWSDVGGYEEAGQVLCQKLYAVCAPVKAERIRYVVKGKDKYLEFSVNENAAMHPTIRAYGRSSKIKEEWLGEYAYHMLGWDNFDNPDTHNKWGNIDADIVLHYERNSQGTLIANGIGHNLVDPQAVAEGDVPF